ncbi:carboxymuconolactone decarboxylase family protein [Hydrocarboniphaga sp.]|uniref:carboxymuconolactone decarboxylase family protein n=1 Tax=Hydrocarboniphaga sp. TaxID=2033016 RepID=UPI003D0AC184
MTQDHPASPRIVPQLPSDWDEAAKQALAAFPKSYEFVINGWNAGERQVRGMNVLGLLAHYPALARAFMTLNAHVAGASSLPYRDREIVILRLSWLMHSEYELVQHMILGKRAGLSDDEIQWLRQGPDAAGWPAGDADLVRAVDELHALSRITPASWSRLSRRYDHKQMLDLVFLFGCYGTLALVINSTDMPIEGSAPPLDPAIREQLLNSQARP